VGSLPQKWFESGVVNGSDWKQPRQAHRRDGALTKVVTTTSDFDAVLLVVNLMINPSKKDCKADVTIRKALLGSNMEKTFWKNNITLPCCDQPQFTSFWFTDVPAVPGSYRYGLQFENLDCVRGRGQIPLLDAVVLPPSMQTHHSHHNALNSTSVQNKAIIAPRSATDQVLVSVRFAIHATSTLMTDNVVKVIIFRNMAPIETTLISLPDNRSDTYYTLSYLDSPNTTLPTIYTIGSVYTTDAQHPQHTITNLTHYISSNITLLSTPATNTNTTISTTPLHISTSTYTPIGLQVTITPQHKTEQVLLTVSINTKHLANATASIFTILRSSNGTTTNLGDALFGIHFVPVTTIGYYPVSFTIIDTPNIVGTVTYAVVAKCTCAGGSSTNKTCDRAPIISAEGQVRQLTAVILPATFSNTTTPVHTTPITPNMPMTSVVRSDNRNDAHTTNHTKSYTYTPTDALTNFTSNTNTTHNINPYTLTHSMALQSTPDPFPIAFNSPYTVIGGLPAQFAFTFSLTLPDYLITAGDTNILDIRDTASGRSLVKLDRLDSYGTILSYDNDKLYTSAADTLLPTSVGGIPIERTYYRITIQDTYIQLESSLPMVRSTPITRVSTAGKLYTLYVSNPTDDSSGGDFSYFTLTGM